jgi:chemotaxis protein methyltransferase CheR
MLARAAAAMWPVTKADEIPPALLKRFMRKGICVQAGTMKAGPEIRSLVRFQRINLHDDLKLIAAKFDLIFCRNVLIYFDAASKRRAVSRMVSHLSPDGLLFVGHAENLNTVSSEVRTIAPTIYARSVSPGGQARQ